MSIRTRWTGAIALVATAALVAACGGGGEQAAAPPPEEGEETLVIYSGRNEELVGGLVDQMRAQLGTNIDVRYGSTGEMSAQIIEEGPNSPADVFFGQDAGALGALSQAGLLAPLPEEVVAPALEQYRAQDNTWVGTSGRARVIAYNPDLVQPAELPNSIEELLDPRWAGQIGFSPSNASWLSYVTGLRLLDGDDAARQWLTGFAATGPQQFENNGAIMDAVNAGTVQLGLTNHYYLYEEVAEVGVENYNVALHYVPNSPLGLINVAGAGVVASSDQPELAQQAVAFLLSAEAQQYLVDQTAEYPTVPGIVPAETAVPLPALETLQAPAVNLGDLDDVAPTEAMLQETGLL